MSGVLRGSEHARRTPAWRHRRLQRSVLDEPRTPAGSGRLACALHAASTSLAEIRDLLAWFGAGRTRQAVHHWFYAYADACEQEFTVEPDRVTVDEKQIQLAEEQRVWLYALVTEIVGRGELAL